MEVDDYHFCELLQMEPVPTMPDEDLMQSEVAILSGGRDQNGRPLVTFPAQNHGILESKVKASGLDRILRYYIDVTSPTTKVHGFAFVTDLRFSTMDFISMLKSSLNSLQAETTNVSAPFVLYLIQPINKKNFKDTQTLLGLRQSKKKKNKNLATPLFQTIVVTDEMDLYNYVDKSQVTADLGGYLQYSHSAWIRFRKTVEPFFMRYEEMVSKLPDALGRLEELTTFDLGQTRDELERQQAHAQQLVRDVTREVNLEMVCEQCDDLLMKIIRSDEDETFAAIAQKPAFREVHILAEYCRERLTMVQQRVGAAQQRVEGRVRDEIARLDFTDQVQSLIKWLTSDGPRGLKRLEIADSLGQAEMLSNHFETGLAYQAEEKLTLARDLIEQAQTMVVDEGNRNIAELRNAARDLERCSSDFQDLLEDRRNLLSTVHGYHSHYDKIAKWCVKALKFLPSDLIDVFDDIGADRLGNRRRRGIGDAEYQWTEDACAFLHKNRPPKDDDLALLTESAESIAERVKKKKARHLCHRCAVLLKVLNPDELASNEEVLQAVKWRSEVVGNREGNKNVRQRSRGVPKRKDGDGVAGVRTRRSEKVESENGFEVDDPLLQRIGKRMPEAHHEVKGRTGRGESPEVDDVRDVEDPEKHNQDGNALPEEKPFPERVPDRGQSSERTLLSKDFWAGRIPGIARSEGSDATATGNADAVDGPSEHQNMPSVNALYNGATARRILQNSDTSPPPANVGVDAANVVSSGKTSPADVASFQHLNRNQNVNPTPELVQRSAVPQTSLVGSRTAQALHQMHQSWNGNFAVNPSGLNPPPMQQSDRSFKQFNGTYSNDGRNVHQKQYLTNFSPQTSPNSMYSVDDTGLGPIYVMYDPVTGLPRQENMDQDLQRRLLPSDGSGYSSQPAQIRNLHQEAQIANYLSGGQYGIPRTLPQYSPRQVNQYSSVLPMPTHRGHLPDRVIRQDCMQALNIGLSPAQDSRSGTSMPGSDRRRETSPYQDVLNRIAQLRVRAQHPGSSGKLRERRKRRTAEMRAAKSVPNLSNLLAGVQVDNYSQSMLSNGGSRGQTDRQSDYYARLSRLADDETIPTPTRSNREWVSRLMEGQLHYSETEQQQTDLPLRDMEGATKTKSQRALTPLERFELESLTSLLNDSDDDNDDSAPFSQSPMREQSSMIGNMHGQSPNRTLGTRPKDIDIEADQRELDNIRLSLSTSYPIQSNHVDVTNSFNSNMYSPNQLPGNYSSSHDVAIGYSPASRIQSNYSSANRGATSCASPGQMTECLHYQGEISSKHDGASKSESKPVAPLTDQLRNYFGELDAAGVGADRGRFENPFMRPEQELQEGLAERLRNVGQVEARVSHDDMDTPNFLAEAMETLVKLDTSDRRSQIGLPLEARHMLQRNPSLQLSDEGVIIDGASWDDALEPGSAGTTERESVESGVGSRGRGSNL